MPIPFGGITAALSGRRVHPVGGPQRSPRILGTTERLGVDAGALAVDLVG
jgi:hypothetical protein